MGVGQKLQSIVKIFKSKDMIPVTEYVDKDTILKDKVALISGGSGGIGFSIAKAFIASGAKVIITGTNEKKLQKCCEELGKGAKYLILNLQDVSLFDEKVGEAVSLFPDNKIDILVNSAGRINRKDFFHTDETEWDSVMSVNLKGTYFLCQKVSQYMIDNHIHGHILNVSSSSALRPAWTPYQISKWAINGFTRGLADSLLKYGIIVNAIAPGPTATPMLGFSQGGGTESIQNQETLSGRYAMPSEIAQLAVYLASDCANMVIGDTFYVTGGSGIISMHQ